MPAELRKNFSFPSRLGFALAGITHALRGEQNLRIQTLALLVVLAALLVLRPAPVWWALVVLASSAVLSAELFNTAIEHLADHLHPDVHLEIRIVKDCAAAAVLISSIGAVGVAIALCVALCQHL